jgi:hypothetical protein
VSAFLPPEKIAATLLSFSNDELAALVLSRKKK